jgi:hypothetical protein
MHHTNTKMAECEWTSTRTLTDKRLGLKTILLCAILKLIHFKQLVKAWHKMPRYSHELTYRTGTKPAIFSSLPGLFFFT